MGSLSPLSMALPPLPVLCLGNRLLMRGQHCRACVRNQQNRGVIVLHLKNSPDGPGATVLLATPKQMTDFGSILPASRICSAGRQRY